MASFNLNLLRLFDRTALVLTATTMERGGESPTDGADFNGNGLPLAPKEGELGNRTLVMIMDRPVVMVLLLVAILSLVLIRKLANISRTSIPQIIITVRNSNGFQRTRSEFEANRPHLRCIEISSFLPSPGRDNAILSSSGELGNMMERTDRGSTSRD
jgi:hypothetical protein